jgi:cell division ATPase FtsA
MHEAMQETIKEFVSRLNKVAGDNITSVAIVVTGNSMITDPSQPMTTAGDGLLNITYQTATLRSPIHTDITIIVTKY